MANQKSDYQLLVDRVAEVLMHTPQELAKWVEISEEYINAASEMTKDELALIQAYLKRDMHTFGDKYQQAKKDENFEAAFRDVITNSIWERLADITDKTQLEWQEVLRDIEHHGSYHAGEIVGIGQLACEHCGHKVAFNHVSVLNPCIKCGGKIFQRYAA